MMTHVAASCGLLGGDLQSATLSGSRRALNCSVMSGMSQKEDEEWLGAGGVRLKGQKDGQDQGLHPKEQLLKSKPG